jgi:hypothetical protein
MNTLRRFGGGWLRLRLPLLCSLWRIEAQPVIYEATGTKDQIQPVIDQFEHDITYGVGGSAQNPPPFIGSYQVATFDDVGSATNRNLTMILSGGLHLMGGSADTMYVSGGGLPSFSPPNSLTLVTEATSSSDFLFVNDLINRHLPNAFGAVFANVESSTAAGLEGFLGGTPFHFGAQPTTGPNDFSFIGVIYPTQVFSTTTIRMDGTHASPPNGPPSSDSVVADDLILGLAPPLPEPNSIFLMLFGGLVTWITLRNTTTCVSNSEA